MSTTKWSDVKNDPTQRIVYHNDNFQELVESAEELSKSILSKANSIEDKAAALALRLVLDGMVKCFDQFYYDVNSGFADYKPAVFNRKDETKVELSLAELTMIEEALDYSLEQVDDSLIPVFGSFSHTTQYTDDEGRVFEYTAECDEEEVAGIKDAIASIKSSISQLYVKDGGIIEINA